MISIARTLVRLVPGLLLFLSASMAAAEQPSLIAAGQNVALWESTAMHLRFIVRNNLNDDRDIPFELSGDGIFETGVVSVSFRSQASLAFLVPPLEPGIHGFFLTLFDSEAEPDTVFWSTTSLIYVVDSVSTPEFFSLFEPSVIHGPDPATYRPIDKLVVVKIPKAPRLQGPDSLIFHWEAFMSNPDPGSDDLLSVFPEEGDLEVHPGDEIELGLTVQADVPVPFGTMNQMNLVLFSQAGDSLFTISTPVVTDSLPRFQEILTGVREGRFEPNSWSGVKSLFR